METTNKDKAMDTFIGVIKEIDERLNELKGFMENHMGYAPEDIGWGHVGSAQHFLEKLTELTDEAYMRGEYAQK